MSELELHYQFFNRRQQKLGQCSSSNISYVPVARLLNHTSHLKNATRSYVLLHWNNMIWLATPASLPTTWYRIAFIRPPSQWVNMLLYTMKLSIQMSSAHLCKANTNSWIKNQLLRHTYESDFIWPHMVATDLSDRGVSRLLMNTCFPHTHHMSARGLTLPVFMYKSK